MAPVWLRHFECVQLSDLRRVGGFDTSIVGWGKEDVDLYEKFIRSNVSVFRSVDVGLVHVFHKIECDESLPEEQMIMCMGSKATSIASQRRLSQYVQQKLVLFLDEKNATALNKNQSSSSILSTQTQFKKQIKLKLKEKYKEKSKVNPKKT